MKKIKQLLTDGYAIKCDKDGNFFVSETPYNEKPTNYKRLEIYSSDFDEAITELKGIKTKSSTDGYQIYYMNQTK